MTARTENRVRVWRMPDLYDAEMLKGAYVRHQYPWHSHEELSLGVVVDGAIRLRTPSREGIAKAGSFVLVNTDEVHQGAPMAPQGWRCRTIHILPSVVSGIAEELRRFMPIPTLAFRSPTFEDAELAKSLLELHHCSEASGSSLERQSRIAALIAKLLAHHAEAPMSLPPRSREPVAVSEARAYLDEHLSNKVTLDALAAAAGVPPFRLLRAFHQTFGLTPHAYQTQARVRMAHRMLRQKVPLAEVAVEAGFADQAHLTRVFKSIMGATPGQFRSAALAA